MEKSKRKVYSLRSLPGGRRGTPGAGAGCFSMRSTGGRELSRRASIAEETTADITPHPHQSPRSPSSLSSHSLFASPSSSPQPYEFRYHQRPPPSLSSSPSLSSVDVVQEASANNPAPAAARSRARMRWTNEMNEFIWRTYLFITHGETKIRGYLDPLYIKFTEKFPGTNVSKQRIGDQRRAIVRNKLIPNDSMQSIKNEVLRVLDNNQSDNNSTQTSGTNPVVNNTTRLRWTDDINEGIMKTYYIITHLESNRSAYRKELHTKITEQFPQISHVSEQRIADQRRVIVNNRLVSEEKLEEIKREVREILRLQQPQAIDNTNTYDRNTHNNITINQDPNEQDNITYNNEELNNLITETFENAFHKYSDTNPIERPFLPKQKTSRKFSYIISFLNSSVLPKYDTNENNFIQTHLIIYCAAYTAAKCNGAKIRDNNELSINNPNRDKRPNWLRRMDYKIQKLRRDIGRMTQYIQGNRSVRLIVHIDRIKNKHRIHSNYEEPNQTNEQYLDSLKQKLNAASSRRRRYHNCTLRKTQNITFQNNQKQFYRQLISNSANTHDTIDNSHHSHQNSPAPRDLHEFWSNIWSRPVHHNEHAEWIKEDLETLTDTPEMIFDHVPLNIFINTINRTHNWKSPGSDNIHNYYYKKFTTLHPAIYNHINDFIKNPELMPTFITQGVTYMIPKDLTNLTDPAKYRPITCLQTIYKIITSCISQIISKHLLEHNILAEEQKGCRKNSQGCKEQLIIDTIAMKHNTRLQKDICTMYVDYQKAYDSIPHSWLICILKHYKVHPTIISFLSQTMHHWKTKLKIGRHVETETIPIKRGIFQGDAFSPLWFCMALNPLSKLLNRSNDGILLSTNNIELRLSHLFFVDDIKLFSNSIQALHHLADIIQSFSNDIQMTFGIDKCKTFTLRKGKSVESVPYMLPSGQQIESIDHFNTYKYLGFQQSSHINHKLAKTQLIKTYKHRLNILMTSQLTSGNLTKAINSFAIPVLTYSFGIINWSKTDFQKLQRLINTTMTSHRKHHPRSCVQRMTLPREDGGRGFIDLQNLHNKLITSLRNFFHTQADHSSLHFIVSQLDNKFTPLNLHDENLQPNQTITENKDKLLAWEQKSLHGRHRTDLQQPHVDIRASNAWLQRGELFPETEGFMIAIQDQTIDTGNYQKYIIRRPNFDDMCRRCHSASETIQHITGACKSIAQTDYKHRHDQVAAIIHQNLAIQTKLIKDKVPYYKYKPESVLENNLFKIYWDRTIITDKTIYNNRPDILILDKQNKSVNLIDIAICNTHNLTNTHTEKIAKYTDLSIEIKTQWQVQHIRTIPIILSSTGVIPKTLHTSLATLNMPPFTYLLLQKAVILNTCRLTRKFLNN